MTDRDTLRERLDAVADTLDDNPTQTLTAQEREAVRAALAWRYDNNGTVDADAEPVEILSDAAKHVADPHATALRDILAGGDT